MEVTENLQIDPVWIRTSFKLVGNFNFKFYLLLLLQISIYFTYFQFNDVGKIHNIQYKIYNNVLY